MPVEEVQPPPGSQGPVLSLERRILVALRGGEEVGLVVQQRIEFGTCFWQLEAKGHKNAPWAAGSSPSWQCALAAWFRNHGGKLASGEEERVDRTFGLSEYLASHESALPAGNLRTGGESSQAHCVEDSQPPPLRDEELPTPGPPVAETGWCRADGITFPLSL